MADKKISELTELTTPDGTEELVVNDSGVSKKITIATATADKLPLAGGTMTGDVSLGDNVKAKFGAGDDLQIHHSGTHSWINDTGTGNLYIQSNGAAINVTNSSSRNLAQFNTSAGTATLYHDNGTTSSAKLATTSTGVSVGTTSGSNDLDILSGTGGVGTLNFNDGADSGYVKYNHNINSMQFATAGSERMRIDSSGNVGIGTSSPDAPFTIQRPSNNQGIAAGLSLKGQDGTTQGGLGTDGVIDNAVQLVAAQFLKFHTNNTDGTTNERMRIDSSGNVGIGTSSPKGAGLSVGTTDGSAFISPGGNNNHLTLTTTGSGGALRFFTKGGTTNNRATGEAMRIDSSGNVGIGTSSPSHQLDIWKTTTPATDTYSELQLRSDNYGFVISGGIRQGVGGELVFKRNQNGVLSEKIRFQSGGGISFNGDTAAANALDDYEEGTWTPVLTPATGAFTTVDTISGTYTKIGRAVHLEFSYRITSIGTAAGVVTISGVPFAMSANRGAGVTKEIQTNGTIGAVYPNGANQFTHTLPTGASPIGTNYYWIGAYTDT